MELYPGTVVNEAKVCKPITYSLVGLSMYDSYDLVK